MRRAVVITACLLAGGACKRSVEPAVVTPPATGALRVDSAALGRSMAQVVEKQKRCAAAAERPVTLQEELDFGAAMAIALLGELPPRPERDLSAVQVNLNLLGKALASGAGRDALPWTFVAVDSPAVASFSAPGGFVFVTTGLLELVENEAQLAGVLALHIAHVSLRHDVPRLRKAEHAACVGQAAAADVELGGLPVAGAPFDLRDAGANPQLMRWVAGRAALAGGYTPAEERAAARLASQLVAFACYDPREAAAFFAKLPSPPQPDGGLAMPHLDRAAFAAAVAELDVASFRVSAPPSPAALLLKKK